MWTISEVKAKGREAFKANYWKSVLVTFILSMVTGVAYSASSAGNTSGTETSTLDLTTSEQLAVLGILGGVIGIGLIIGLLIRIFIKNPLEVGCYNFFKKNVLNPPADLGAVKEGFSEGLTIKLSKSTTIAMSIKLRTQAKERITIFRY